MDRFGSTGVYEVSIIIVIGLLTVQAKKVTPIDSTGEPRIVISPFGDSPHFQKLWLHTSEAEEDWSHWMLLYKGGKGGWSPQYKGITDGNFCQTC